MTNLNNRDLIVAGVMTGNSLDAVDVATFRATLEQEQVTSFKQLAFTSEPYSAELREEILRLKDAFKREGGVPFPALASELNHSSELYQQAINRALTTARSELVKTQGLDLDLIGVHGQTLAHFPPSLAVGREAYTVQLADGSQIADVQGVVTVADFRSDDLLNGGEGAPFAPAFNALLAPTLKLDTAIFINAGNTSNIAVIRNSTKDVLGWDCGPCNQFIDQLMREECDEFCDLNGTRALSGSVRPGLLRALWDQSVVREDGSNGLEIKGRRSFDPQWYRLPAELKDKKIPFQDRLRSVVAFSAYCIAHSLTTALESGFRPEQILLFGGGWKNQALTAELKDLCQGKSSYILEEHKQLFKLLPQFITDNSIRLSDEVGLPNSGMEAGIFAFAAVQRVLNQSFTQPSFTNCHTPTRCGAIFIPSDGSVAPNLAGLELADDRAAFGDLRLSRATLGNQRAISST